MFTKVFTQFAAGCTHDFFGLVPWYRYLNLNATCDITTFRVLPNGASPSDIPLVLLAIIDDLLRVAGIVAVAYLIYAAIQYVTSQGNPEQTSRAQSTILNALIGLVIAIIAVGIVSFIGSKFGQ